MATNDRFFDDSAIDSDSDWESDGLDEVVRSFQRVPYTKPAAGPSLISIEIAQGGMIPGNGGTLPTHPLGHGRHILRRSGKATAKSLALSDSELSSYLSEISMSDSQASSNASLGAASATTASTSQSSSNPDEGCLMLMTRRPPRLPPTGTRDHPKFPLQPENTPVTPFNSPKTIRQTMVKRELPCSLRENLLLERYLKNATAEAVLRRRHTTPNVAHLNRRRRVSRTNPNRTCNDIQILRNGYNDKGW